MEVRPALFVLVAAFLACGGDQFVTSADGGLDGAASDGNAPPTDGAPDAQPPPDGSTLCGGLPCGGQCLQGRVCQLAGTQDVRCLRLGPSDVFFITKDLFGRVPKNGGNTLTAQAAGADQQGCALSSNGNSVYVADPSAGTVRGYSTALPMGMIPPSTVIITQEPGVRALASALPALYWNSADLVRTCDVSMGCTKASLASNVFLPNQVVVDGGPSGTVYFATTTPNAAEIRRVPANGGMHTPFLNTVTSVRSMVVQGTDLFFTTADKVFRADKTTGNPQQLAGGRVEPQSVVADATHAYWAEGGSGGAVARAVRNGTGQPAVFASMDTPVSLDLDGTHVYVAAKGGIYRVPKQ